MLIDEIEGKIDKYMYDILDDTLPRNKYIYHCNLAYIDIVIDSKMLFTYYEKDYLFSLDYNTFLAHRKLKEEKKFDYAFDQRMYRIAFNMIFLGFQYSLLCNVFPLLHAGKANIKVNEDKSISFESKNIPRKHFKYIEDYSTKKTLSYILQIATGKLQEECDEDIAMKLMKLYFNFWNENMMFSDFEPYNRLEWGGVNIFFILASMRRFIKLYKADFDIVSVDSQKMMILLSPRGVKGLREYVITENEEMYEKIIADHIYKPLGNNMYPKSSVADAPINVTKDGFMFVNPLVQLFNDSCETRFLTYLRKYDNPRYLKIKDKIKERAIPLITEMIKYKFPYTNVITNFDVSIPGKKKHTRECDLLIIDENGYALYLEVKHFYYPQSFCELRNVDAELKKALKKLPDQLYAIKENWDNIKSVHGINSDLESINGIIVSHRFTGFDLDIVQDLPIVSLPALYECIAESGKVSDIYEGCIELDGIYSKVKFVQKHLKFSFAGYDFEVDLDCLDPEFEILFIFSRRKEIAKYINFNEPAIFNNVKDLARAYIDEWGK